MLRMEIMIDCNVYNVIFCVMRNIIVNKLSTIVAKLLTAQNGIKKRAAESAALGCFRSRRQTLNV